MSVAIKEAIWWKKIRDIQTKNLLNLSLHFFALLIKHRAAKVAFQHLNKFWRAVLDDPKAP